MSFFSSEIGVAIAWICGVAGFLFGIFQKQVNKKLVLKLQNSLNTSTSNSEDNEVHQIGEKNVYTKINSGGMNIKM